MFEFISGAVAGAVLAVMSPPVYRWIAEKVAQAKDKFQG